MNTTQIKLKLFVFLFFGLTLSGSFLWAAPEYFTFQTKILKPDGTPLEAPLVNFRFTILDPDASCILYIENYAAVNMTGSKGLVAFNLGAGARMYPASGTIVDYFNNHKPSGYVCQNSNTHPTPYVPLPKDQRKVVMQFNDTTGWQSISPIAINSVPYSNYASLAQNSVKLNDIDASEYVTKSMFPTCNSGEVITFNGVSFSCTDTIANSGSSGSGGGGGGGSGGGSGGTSFTVASPLFITGTASAPQIEIKQVSNSEDGYLSSTDYVSFKNKLSASSAAIASTLGYTPLAASSAAIVSTLGYTPVSNVSSSVIAALGFTPLEDSYSSIINTLGYTPAISGSVVSSQWSTSGTTLNYLNGNVGIGTNAPVRALDVVRDGDAATSVGVSNASSGTSAYSQYTLKSDVAQGMLSAWSSNYSSGVIWQRPNSLSLTTNLAASGGIAIAARHSSGIITLQTGSLERMRITSTGNIGIGTTSPSARLDVSGTIKISGGNPGVGKVLTSDALGNATWETVSAGGAGSVTEVTSANNYITIVSGTSTPQISLNVGSATNTVAAGDDPRLSDARIPTGPATGDLSGTYPNPSVVRLRGVSVTAVAPTSGTVLSFNGSQWSPQFIYLESLRSTVNSSQPLFGNANCSSTQVMFYQSSTDTFECRSFEITAASISGTITVAQGGTGASTASANTFFGGPTTGGANTPSFRSLASADIPAINLAATGNGGVTGLLPAANGGSQWTTSGTSVSINNSNIIIGGVSATTTARLHVSGTVVGNTNKITSGNTVNLALSNTHVLASVGSSTINLSNMMDGGVYTIIITDLAQRMYTFPACTNSYFVPANSTTTASSRTIYGITTINTTGTSFDCYITWTSGYQ